MISLAVYVGFALGVSFICSLLEATLLASRNAILNEQRSAGSRGSGFLLDLKRHRVDDAISAILTINTIANTLGATMAGAQAGRVFENAWVGVFSGVLTLLILVLSEIIPKTLGTVYAQTFSPFVGWTLLYLTRVMAPILIVTGALTRSLTRGRTNLFSKPELQAIVAAAHRDGTLSAQEAEIFGNLLHFDDVQVEDVMTPRTVAFMMPHDASISDLLSAPHAQPFSRVPLYQGTKDNVLGYVLLDDILRAVVENHCDRGKPLEDFARPISFIPELATVGVALRQIVTQREHMAMVTDELGNISGLITLEDLTETILGVEIVDESDRVTDLREAAGRMRDRRLERLRTRGIKVDW